MAKSNEKLSSLPAVLSLVRRINVTDGLFYSVHADGSEHKLLVKRGGLRGTQNVNKNYSDSDDKKAKPLPEVSNIQLTDSAKSDSQAVGVVVRCGVNFLPLTDVLHSCVSSKDDKANLAGQFRASLNNFLGRAFSDSGISEGLLEVSRRYARNIANAGWLWRNRQFSSAVTIEVTTGDETLTFDALRIPLHRFSDYSEGEQKLARYIAESLSGKGIHPLHIKAKLDFGAGMNQSIEVYPSQNYLGGKKPSGFARSLYAVETEVHGRSPSKEDLMDLDSIRVIGHAALRDTKIANALRTFDTWYPSYGEHGMAIAVEPLGANLSAQRFFRAGHKDADDKKLPDTSAFVYARSLGTLDTDSDEGKFMIASLIRGGVYSESGDK